MAALDLLLPTLRWNSYVKGYIGYLVCIAEGSDYDLRLHIGDNSRNADKHEFLSRLASPRIQIHLHSSDLGVHPNVTHLFRSSAGEFVQLLGDDDWIHPSFFAQVTLLERSPELSCCAGLFAAIPPGTSDSLVCLGDRFMGSDPVRRATGYAQYLLWETGINWIALAIHRRSTMETYIEYTLRHPFPFYFRDQVLSQIALLTGQVKGVREGFQFYNNRRPEEIAAHMENLYKALDDFGLPRWLYYYYDYWLACEYACLFLYRRLPDKLFGDRMAAADQIFVKVFNRYRDNYRQK